MPYFSVSGEAVTEKSGVVIPRVSASRTPASRAASKADAVAKHKARTAAGEKKDTSGGSSGLMKYLPWAAGALGVIGVVVAVTRSSKKTESRAAA